MNNSFNQHNQEYYQSQGTTGVPDILATAQPIQEAIRCAIESHISTDPIKILELGFGTRPDRYTHIAHTTNRLWDVTLSDFSIHVLPQELPVSPFMTFHSLSLNLLTQELPAGPYDVILSTYTFDSIDFPEDSYQNQLHYPGGLIRIAQNSLQHLNPNGFFLTIDKWASENTPQFQPAGGANFKALDLQTAQNELSQLCCCDTVTLLNLNDFLDTYHQQLPIDLSVHGCLVVTKASI